MLAAVHLSPAITVPLAILAGLWVCWYCIRLGRPPVPESRRRIRRVSLLVMLTALPPFVRAASYLDPALDQHKHDYILSWTLGLFLLGVVVILAAADMFNNIRLQHRQEKWRLEQAAANLAQAVEAAARGRGHGGQAGPHGPGVGPAPSRGRQT